MGLTVYLESDEKEKDCCCDKCGHNHVTTGKELFYSANITHNLNDMAEQAGIYKELWRPEEIGITKAQQLELPLSSGLVKLLENPTHYKLYEAENGWGTYEGFVKFVQLYLAACVKYPNANVIASR